MAEIVDFGLQKHKIKMDSRYFENVLSVVAGDTGRRIEVQLLDTNGMVQDTTGLNLRLNALIAGEATFTDATLVDAATGKYQLDLSNGMFLAPGNWEFQWQITDSVGKKLHSFAFTGNIGSNISEGGSQATNFYLNLEDLKAMQEDLVNGTFDSGVLETNIAEKLTDLETQYAPKLTEVTAQLEQKIGLGKKAELEDLSSTVLSAIEGGEGTSFDLLSIPQDSSVTIEKLSSDVVTVLKSDNLLNLNGDIRTGGFMQGGNFVANEAYTTSHKFYVKKNDVVRYGYNAGMGASHSLQTFDKNGNYLGALIGVLDATSRYREVSLEHVDVDHFFVSYSNNGFEQAMVTVNKPFPLTYQSFYDVRKLSNTFDLNDKQIETVLDITEDDKLSGKIGAFNGDSIMAGAGYAGGFAKIISDRNGMLYENIAVGGGTIAGGTKYQDGRDRHWVSRTVSNMRSDADYAIILAGVNDGSLGVPMGEYTSGYEDVYDDTTFCGAIESTCSQLIQRFSGKKIGFIIPHKMSPAQATYVPKLIEGLEKWGVPYLNLYKEVPSLNYINSLKIAYTHNDDGWHPNEQGYRKYYVDKTEAWMKAL